MSFFLGRESNAIGSLFFFLIEFSSAMRNIELIVKTAHICQKFMCNFLVGFQGGKLHSCQLYIIYKLLANSWYINEESEDYNSYIDSFERKNSKLFVHKELNAATTVNYKTKSENHQKCRK
jgi:hypothetical protein